MSNNSINSDDIYVKVIHVMRCIFLILIALVLTYFVLGQIFMPSEKDSMATYSTMSKGWLHTDASGTVTTVSLPAKVTAGVNEAVSITNKLPKDLTGINSICYHGMWQNVKIYIGGELRNEYSTENTRLFGHDSTVRFVFADVHPEDAGKEVIIETTSGTTYSGHFREVYIGEKMGIFMHLFDMSAPKSLLGLSMIIFSLLCIIACAALKFSYKRPIPLMYLGWGVFFAAFWLLSEIELRQFIFNNVSVLSNLTFWSLMFIPPPFVVFISETQNHRHKKIHALSLTYHTIIVMMVSLWQIFNINDFRNTLPLVHIGIVLSIGGIMLSIFLDIKNKLVKEYSLVAFGLLGIVVGTIFELYFFYVTTNLSVGTSLSIALVFLLIMASIKTVQDLLNHERDRQHAILANDAKAKFLANMSHEIRTPINTVIGMNEMILRECTDPAIQEYSNYIQTSSKMLLSLINDILDFSKIESGQYEIIDGSYHLDTLLIDELNLLEARAHKKNLEIILNADEKLPSNLWGDELRIKQIMTNILTNAVKYTEKGSITIDAGFTWIDNDTINLIISITDTGSGIKQEDLNKLFESFTRIEEKKNRNIEGTGLGLNIAKMLVSLMGGQIDVKSTYGTGSTFTVTIPQKVLSYEKIGNLHNNKKKVSSANSANSEMFTAPDARILVVDDNEMNLAVVKGLLKRNLVQIDTARSGRQALELMENNYYDVILMDHMMPELDGVETLNLMRKDEDCRCRDSCVIALTANAIAGSHDLYIGYGFNDYLSKPVEATHLEQCLMKYLPKRLIKSTNSDSSTSNNNNTDSNGGKKTMSEETILNTLIEDETNNNTPTSNTSSDDRPTNIINKEKALEFCAGSEELYNIIIATYYEQGLTYVNQVKEFFEAKDWHNYRIVVHALKSSSMNIGAENFSAESLKQEMAAKESNEALITETFDEYYDNLLSIMETVKNIIGA